MYRIGAVSWSMMVPVRRTPPPAGERQLGWPLYLYVE
jgi:hypothetical protein